MVIAMPMNGQLWVEPVGGLIVARVRGQPTEQLLRECQDRVLQIAHCEAIAANIGES